MRDYLEHITGRIPDQDWEAFQALSYPEQRKKGDVILEFGKQCKHIWYLKKGAVRKMENINGTNKTTHFYVASFMFTVYRSLLRGVPSLMSIVCESDCEFDVIPFSELVKLYDQSHAVERVGRIIAEHQYIEEFDLRRALLNMDALERYEYLGTHQPEIFQHFQLKDIATFMGVTPVSLSRLRKLRWDKR
ncbi:MAG: cyclic nucleotide-binding domain-containing protein [Bacteroidota bacterium]